MRLTLLFAVAFAAGLVILTVVAIRLDGQLRHDRLDATLRVKARAVQQAVYFDEQGTFHVEGVRDDPALAQESPDVYVVALPTNASPDNSLAVAFSPSDPTFTGLDLLEIARRAMDEGGEIAFDASADGTPARLLALPIVVNEQSKGAIITAADPAPARSDHHRLALILWLACAGLTVGATATGYLLAGQSIRPAGRALDEQGRFLADAAHELRTPLAALLATIEAGLAGAEEPREALERLAPVARRAGTLVDDLLTLARIDAGRQPLNLEPLRLDLLVEEVLEGHHGVALTTEPTVVRGDPGLLRRLVQNLVDNAGRHGRRLDPAAPIEVSVDQWGLTVADRGPGIEPTLEGRLFERFSAGRHSGGAGLGLAIAAWIAGAHGARLEGKNREGGGAVFHFVLPR